MKLKVPYEKLNMLSPEFNQTLADLADTADRLGADGEADADRSHVEFAVDNDKLPLNIADMLNANDVIIENFPLFIEVVPTDSCPFLEDGTWEDWKLPNHTFYESDGRIFVGTNAHTNEDMLYSELSVVRESLVLGSELPVNNIK